MDFSVKSNAAVFRKAARAMVKDLRMAQAKALTFTAKDLAEEDSPLQMERAFDKPIPFTKRGTSSKWAKPQRLKATVFVKDIQAGYLALEETGGRRQPKRTKLPVPLKARRNKYGNMPRGYLKSQLARKDVFQGRINGTLGVWQRLKGGKVRLLVAYTDGADYQKRFHWRETMRRMAIQRFPEKYGRQLRAIFRK